MELPLALATGLASRPKARPAALKTYRIHIKDLMLMVRIGVYDYEKLAPQRVRVTVAMDVVQGVTPFDDNIDNVVSYDVIVDGIKALAARGHINLVETFADGIADICLADTRVQRVRLVVEKLDVFPDTDGVGVEIERQQPGL